MQDLSPFCTNCFSVLTGLCEILSHRDWLDFVFTSKKYYSTPLKRNSSSPVLHRYWVSFLNIGFDLDCHWKLVLDGFTENFKNDLLWLIMRTVKVRDSLKWGIINSDKCSSCPRKERIDHCFLNCVCVKPVWSYFSSAFSLLLGVSFILQLSVCLFFSIASGWFEECSSCAFFDEDNPLWNLEFSKQGYIPKWNRGF